MIVIWLYTEDLQGSKCNIIEQLRFLTYLQYRPVTIAHMRVIFSVVYYTFYSVSEVQIHAWFKPMATRGSQRGYKYYHACVAKAVFHA